MNKRIHNKQDLFALWGRKIKNVCLDTSHGDVLEIILENGTRDGECIMVCTTKDTIDPDVKYHPDDLYITINNKPLFKYDKAMKILITGGPVHAYLDAVKIITNKFKGGLMAELANTLQVCDKVEVEITYLTVKGAKLPTNEGVKVLYHDGFEDYRKQVSALAPQFDAVILGAAVANLIPLHPLKGKFPSHNYKPGDVIPIEFTIAPRIIDEVKKVAPKTHLFGFKLLSGVPHEELISAAYGVLLESKATAVFANDAKDLLIKYTVTKERGVHKMDIKEMAQFIVDAVNDEYYHTKNVQVSLPGHPEYPTSRYFFDKLAEQFKTEFVKVPEGYVFGTIAVRVEKHLEVDGLNGRFLTTCRGKNELDDTVYVYGVDHTTRTVYVYGDNKKASLNAPLMDYIFRTNPEVFAIVHTHNPPSFPELPYAPPGTVRDSLRNVNGSFSIKNHGDFYLFAKELRPL